jgi:hypothetical protein
MIPSRTIRNTTIQKTNNKCCRGCMGKGTLRQCWQVFKLVKLWWKSLWCFIKKLKIDLLYHLAILLLPIYPKDCKSTYKRDSWTLMFISSTIDIVKLCNQDICLTTNEWTKNSMVYIHTYIYVYVCVCINTRVLFNCEEEWNYVVYRKLDGSWDNNVDWDKPSWKIYMSYVFTYMWNLYLKL